MGSPLARFGRRCWLGLAVILVVVAVLLSAARGLLSIVSQHKQELVEWLVEGSNVEMELGELRGRFQNFRPTLVLDQVVVNMPAARDTKFTVEAILLELDLYASITQQTLVFKDVILDGFRIAIPIDPHQQTARSIDFSQTQQSLANIFLRQLKNFRLADSLIEFQLPHATRALFIDNLVWKNSAGLHQGKGRALVLNQVNSGEVDFRIDMQGDAQDFTQLRTRLFAEAKSFDVSALANLIGLPEKASIDSKLNLSLWGEFGAEAQPSWQLHWQPGELNWGEPDSRHQLNIEGGAIVAAREDYGWRIDKLPWQFNLDGQALSDFDFQAVVQQGRVDAVLQNWDFASWAPLSGVLLPEAKARTLDAITGGTLERASLSWRANADQQFRYSATVSQLSSEGAAYLPRVQQLDLSLQGDSEAAELALTQRGGELGLPAQFAEPWQLKNLDARLRLNFAEAGLLMQGLVTEIETTELDFSGRWAMQWQAGEKWPVLSLMSNVELNDAGKAYLYYPAVMPGKVYDYLQPALLAGQAQAAQVLWYGQLNHFPYAQHQGIFQAFVPLQNTVFKFDPNWPELKQLQLDLLFQNKGLFMESRSGVLGTVPAQRISASIPAFSSKSDLYITGEVAGLASGVSDYLKQSPVQGLVTSLEQLDLKRGQVSGEVNLHIPLYGGTVEATGHVDFQNNHLDIKPLGMQLQGVAGRLYFDSDKLRSTGIQSYWRGLPLNFRLESSRGEQDYAIKLDLDGRWSVERSQRALGVGLTDFLDGRIDWRSELNIQLGEEGAFNYQAILGSDLIGVNTKLPQPLSKQRTEPWASVVNLSGNQTDSEFQFELGENIVGRGKLQSADKGLSIEQFYLHLGEGFGEQWDGEGIAATMSMDELDLLPWVEWAKQESDRVLPSQDDDYQNVEVAVPNLRFVRADIAKAKLFQQTLNDLNIAYLPLSKTQLQVQAQELIASVAIPEEITAQDPILINIEQANLSDLRAPDSAEATADKLLQDQELEVYQEQSKHLRKYFPSLKMQCQQCQLGRLNLGEILLELPMDNQQLTDGRLRINWQHSQFTADMSWLEQDGVERSQVKGVLTSSSLDKLITEFDTESPIAEAQTQIDVDLSWDSALFIPTPSTMNGVMKLDMGAGVVTEISDKGTRIFSLASLDTIRRRLKLDFSDVFEKGMHFDSITANVKFDDGVMNNQDFFMDGVAGGMRGKGEVDFRSGNIDYLVTYSPKVTSSLPVLTAFLVTPATGVAVLALQKILEPTIEVITQINFALRGNLSEPKLIELERVQKEVSVPDQLREQYQQNYGD